MRVFGFMPVYEDADWVSYAIENVLDFVDHLIIMEGYQGPPWHYGGNRSKDGTREIVEKYKDHPKVILAKARWSIGVDFGKALCHRKALKIMRRKGIKEGDWYFLCDVDEFYTPKQKETLKRTLKTTTKDFLMVHDRMFVYNFQYYLPATHGRFFRYTPGMQFGWYGQHPLYADGMKYQVVSCGEVLKDDPMFHYSFVRTNDREWKRRDMEVRGFRRSRKNVSTWFNECYLRWTEAAAEKFYRYNEMLFGTYGWFYDNDRTIKKYKGRHPKILDGHPYRHVKDMRELKEKIVTEVKR